MFVRTKALTIATLCFMTAAVGVAGDTPHADEERLLLQRAAFRAVYADAELGNWQAVTPHRRLLEGYLLWPDLRAAFLRARLKTADHDEIESFLDEYGVLKPARELRYRYALHLAQAGRLDDYLAIYRQYYQGLDIANLDCLAVWAEISAGRQQRIVSRAIQLWLVGRSQPDECDPVFDYLAKHGLLTTDHYRERFALAVDARRFTLARYLSKRLPSRYGDEANSWLEAQQKPLDFISATDARRDVVLDRRQLAYATRKLAFDDPLTADTRWRELRRRFSFEREEIVETSRHIALWSARLHLPEAAKMLAALPAAAADTETARWLVRAYLLQHRWAEVIRAIDALPAAESRKNEWRYWQAEALDRSGQNAAAAQIWNGLAAERSYYGFLAADAVQKSYALADQPVTANEALQKKLARMPELIRARELFFVGLEGRGRSEWDAAVRLLSSDEQAQAARLAHRWGWHSRAISTAAAAGLFDDLEIRYPLPWRDLFDKHAAAAGIQNSWAYGVARSESLFMRDIRSSAGAIGVMQILPETGRNTAREISLPYTGQVTLTDSSSNIRLGTWYLGKMHSRFGDNRVLATAAYNAGPLRVQDWLPASGSLDARIWIENIPFNETRSYVRRVLADDVIFSWRLTGRQRRISDGLRVILAAPEGEQTVTTD